MAPPPPAASTPAGWLAPQAASTRSGAQSAKVAMSGTPAKIETDQPTLRTPDAALPHLRSACMISSCNRSNAQSGARGERLGLANGPVNPANSRVRDWFRMRTRPPERA
jgi:hypothetical protein